MAKWMQFLLDGGRAGGANGKALLSKETFAELFTPQTIAPYEMYPTTRLTRPHWMTYGLGWFQQDYRGRAVDFHTGSIDGMVAIHGLIRDERLGVYVLGNLDHTELRHALMYTVFDRYAGRSDHDWSAEFLKLYAGLQNEADEERAKKDARRVSGTAAVAAGPEVRGRLLGSAPRRREGHGRGRRAGDSLRRRVRGDARALALQHVPRDVEGGVAGAGAGELRPRQRWRASHARDDGRALLPEEAGHEFCK